METPRVAVIGGGISGLACAYKLLELKEKNKKDLEIMLFEKGGRWGGTIESQRREGFLLEKGPDSFLSEKPFAVDLAKRLGIETELIGTQDAYRRSFVMRHDRLIPIPDGFYLIAPTVLSSFLKTPLFSLSGKMRMMMEPLCPKRKETADESVGSFIRRRFGRQALERVGQPMIAGIYTGDPEALSILATLPRFRDMEQKYGSVTRGLLASAKLRKEKAPLAAGPRYSLFLSFKEGMETLTRTLAGKLPPASLRLHSEIKQISYDGYSKKYKIILQNGEIRSADAVCLTLPAFAASELLKNSFPEISRKLAGISYESVATVNLAYRREQIRHPLDGFGFVVPRTENASLVACSFSSRKFSFRSPEDHVLLRAFVGGVFGRDMFNREDKAMLAVVKNDLSRVLGIQGEPALALLQRYPGAMVQYGVDHLNFIKEIEQMLLPQKNLYLTGSAYRGVGIPDCIADAERQAEKIYQECLC